jgi:predicted dehydrogenase
MMRRREFLSASLAAAAPEDRIRIGFLGSSHSHAEAKIRIVKESPRWELAGVSKDGGPTRDALLGDPSIRVVAVESDVKLHAEHARLALEAGKHVHLEKPPSDNMREFRELAALARRKNLLVQLGYMWRYHPGINAILEAARKGWLGDVYLVRGMINTITPAEQRAGVALFPGGFMFELGCHLIDPLVRLMGLPARVTPFLRTHGNFNDRLADNTAAVFEYPRAMGIVGSSALQPGAFPHRAFEVFGSNGTALVRPIEPGTLLSIDLVKAAGPYTAGAQQVKFAPFRRYVADFDELGEAVRLSRPLSVTPEEDLNVHEALLRASGMWS